jgi:hypothetical protein
MVKGASLRSQASDFVKTSTRPTGAASKVKDQKKSFYLFHLKARRVPGDGGCPFFVYWSFKKNIK